MTEPKKVAVSSHIWNGVYLTWQDACEAAHVIGGKGLDGERWIQRIDEQLHNYREDLRKYGIAMPPRPSNLPLVCAIANPCSIVDFGGSSGWCWDYLTSTLPQLKISSYVVVETNEVVNHMQKKSDRAQVTYQASDAAIGQCDLLYCNSVLQYFESNASLLSLIARTNPKYVFLEDVVARGEDDFFTLQSYWGAGIPYRFLGLKKLLEELSDADYMELVKYPYASPVGGVVKPFEMANFPKPKQLRYSISILLKRRNIQ